MRRAGSDDGFARSRRTLVGMIPFLAHFLFLLAAWTLVIKYIFPIGFALAEGVPLTTYVYVGFLVGRAHLAGLVAAALAALHLRSPH